MMGSQLLNVRLKLEEKRRHIESEKRRMEAVMSRQRQKVGKAAFLQAVTKVSVCLLPALLCINTRHTTHVFSFHFIAYFSLHRNYNCICIEAPWSGVFLCVLGLGFCFSAKKFKFSLEIKLIIETVDT